MKMDIPKIIGFVGLGMLGLVVFGSRPSEARQQSNSANPLTSEPFCMEGCMSEGKGLQYCKSRCLSLPPFGSTNPQLNCYLQCVEENGSLVECADRCF